MQLSEQESLNKAFKQAAEAIEQTKALLVVAGAGMSADSGLPIFRGQQGLWEAYPQLEQHSLDFIDIANPNSFVTIPEVAWGFYGHRHQLYTKAKPGLHYQTVSKWLAQRFCETGFVYTSNVDGLFYRAGVASQQVLQAHGTIYKMVCSHLDECQLSVETGDVLVKPIPELIVSKGKVPNYPSCECGAAMRPLILMFNDWLNLHYFQNPAELAWLKYKQKLHTRKWPYVVLVIGAGTSGASAINAVSRLFLGADKVVNINPTEESWTPFSKQTNWIDIPCSAQQGLLGVDRYLIDC